MLLAFIPVLTELQLGGGKCNLDTVYTEVAVYLSVCVNVSFTINYQAASDLVPAAVFAVFSRYG
jgi:hypothetical protein